MYIISKNKDYYDGAVGMGIDKSIVYERELKSMSIPSHIKEKIGESYEGWHTNSFLHHNSYYRNDRIPKGKFSTYLVVIGFCGKLYPALKTIHSIEIWDYPHYKNVYNIIYDVDEIREFLKKNHSIKKYSWEKKVETDLEKFNNYLLKLQAVDVVEIHREFNTPIFAWGYPPLDDSWGWRQIYGIESNEHDFFINPVLKEYQFAKVFDPYTAFQEIQMFVSGVLPTGDDVDQYPATEKQKVAQHGMNKWSFRRPPNK
jgi:hypothetical protein